MGGGGAEYQKPAIYWDQQRNLAIPFETKDQITAEYLPGSMNVEADRKSRLTRVSSEWKLNSTIFMKFWPIRGTPEMDLLASRVSHQLP